jgi:hypothetical protein
MAGCKVLDGRGVPIYFLIPLVASVANTIANHRYHRVVDHGRWLLLVMGDGGSKESIVSVSSTQQCGRPLASFRDPCPRKQCHL